MKVIPIFLKVDQKPVVIIGNGQMAEAKVNLMLSLDAKIRWLTLGDKITNSYPPQVEIIEADFDEKHLNNAAILFVVTQDKALIEDIINQAERKNIIYNFVDMPKISQFITPAVVKRDDIMVAISTSGKAPVLARNIRMKINQMLPQNIGKLAEFTYNFRPVAQKIIGESKKLFKFWNEVFSDQQLTALLAKTDAEKHQHLLALINQQQANQGQLVEINLTSRQADDLTLKAHHHINIADVVIYGDDMQQILGFARRDAKRIHLTKELNVKTLITPYLANGDLVVYLKPIQNSSHHMPLKKHQQSPIGVSI